MVDISNNGSYTRIAPEGFILYIRKILFKSILMNILALSKFVSAGLGSGYSPVAPGTTGTLGGILFWILLFSIVPDSITNRVILIVACSLPGMLIVHHVIQSMESPSVPTNHIDPSWIVLDEWAGIFITLLFTSTSNPIHIAAGFVFFRVFDISKPGPITYVESFGGAAGIMLDDILAGCFALLLLEGCTAYVF